uniref:Uncharacterized protein n=1 Tax=Arundo donax TaxID=35708 RepID=A0A0A9GL90_ARUDO
MREFSYYAVKVILQHNMIIHLTITLPNWANKW